MVKRKFKSNKQRRAVMAKLNPGRGMRKGKHTYKSIWEGDWDADKVPNIDDKYPFDKSRTEPVNKDISLSEAWGSLQLRRAIYNKNIKKIAGAIGSKKYRVKQHYSAINKQMTRYIDNIEDMGGLTVYANTRLELELAVMKLKRMFKGKIQDYDNKYQVALDKKRAYMAHHFTIIDQGLPYEIQVKTKKMAALHTKMHADYKKYGPAYVKKYTEEAFRLYSLGY